MRFSLLALLLLPVFFTHAQQVRKPEPPDPLAHLNLVVPMRDHAHLFADVYLPHTSGRFPTVLFRTPYSRRGATYLYYRGFTQHGYAVVIESVRGRNGSEGTIGALTQEGPDGSDTINWIAAQPWSDARVFMSGSSYLGMVQWWAAVQRNPHLVAIAPGFSGDDEYTDRYYSQGGALQLGHRLEWLAENLTPRGIPHPLFANYIDHLPLRTADIAATTLALPLWRDALAHPSYDDFWRRRSIRERIQDVNTPALSFGGWFDTYAESDLEAFSKLAAAHKPIETWIGPWQHNPGQKFTSFDFGPYSSVPFRSLAIDWFNRWGNRSPATTRESPLPLLHLFVMGPNIWREEHEWPLARTRFTPFYLSKDGNLLRHPVQKEKPDTYTYDPRDPVPTMGGNICCNPRLLPAGPLDQATIEQRDDVLIYTTAPLREEVEVTGPVKALLYVATSANDTDFTAKLVDVQTNGKPVSICDGIQRMRYRLSLDKPVFVKRNTAYQITIDAGVTSYVFAPGHRIRLEISSSNFPHYDRNLNTAGPNADAIKMNKAKQTVYHEKDYPSALILPVIPRRS